MLSFLVNPLITTIGPSLFPVHRIVMIIPPSFWLLIIQNQKSFKRVICYWCIQKDKNNEWLSILSIWYVTYPTNSSYIIPLVLSPGIIPFYIWMHLQQSSTWVTSTPNHPPSTQKKLRIGSSNHDWLVTLFFLVTNKLPENFWRSPTPFNVDHWSIGWFKGKLQETPIFHGKIYGFL